MQLKNIGQVIELVKARDLRVQEILLCKSFGDLGLKEPSKEEEKKEADDSEEKPADGEEKPSEDKPAEEEKTEEATELSEEDKIKKIISDIAGYN